MAKAKRKRAPNYEPERAAAIVAEAMYVGDKAAAKRWHVSVRTVERYRARVAADATLAALVERKTKALETEWTQEAVAFLRTGLRKLRELAEDCKVDQIRDVAGAIKIVGELQVVREALGGEQPGERSRPAKPGQAPTPNPAADAGGGVDGDGKPAVLN